MIAFPYSHSAEESIWNSFQHILDKASQFASVRVRIWANKTASSLVAYESAYTYCPASAIIVASRFNIRFD